MKDIFLEYKKHIKEILNNKVYIFSIILIAILSYGFTITNFSVGIDDLCADRYVTGTYILSAGRYGTSILYCIFQLFEFTPFWLEMIVTILTVFMGIVFTAFIKKHFGSKLNNLHYIITTGILISYPILHQSFIYQSTNLSVIISNLALMIIPIFIYEIYEKNINLRVYILLNIIMPLFISMYESSCQTYILMIFIICLLQVFNKKKNDKQLNKKLFRYFKICILVLIIAILLHMGIVKIIKVTLDNFGFLKPDYSTKSIPWIDFKEINILDRLKNNIIYKLYFDFKEVSYIRNFLILSLIALGITIYKAIKQKKYMLIPLMIGIITSNFLINIIQIGILYRTDTSWCISIAFFAVFILANIKSSTLQKLVSTIFCIIILFQTKAMNQAFYNDYIRYKKEAYYAYSIANEIIDECEDTKKPIVYLYEAHSGLHQNQINVDNGWSLLNWGSWAFSQPGYEITKFINSLGYNFTIATNEQSNKIYEAYEKSEFEIFEDKRVYELDECIVVIMNYNI